jgi:predicted RNase H-like HicB family nuclease
MTDAELDEWSELETSVTTETDGRYIAECRAIPGALAYGAVPSEAIMRAEHVALIAIRDRLIAEIRRLRAQLVCSCGEPAPDWFWWTCRGACGRDEL